MFPFQSNLPYETEAIAANPACTKGVAHEMVFSLKFRSVGAFFECWGTTRQARKPKPAAAKYDELATKGNNARADLGNYQTIRSLFQIGGFPPGKFPELK